MKIKKCFLLIFAILHLYIFSENFEIESLFEKEVKNIYDVFFRDDLTIVTFPRGFVLYDSKGDELLKSQNITKSSSEALLLEDKIILILNDKQLLQVYSGNSLLNEVDLKEHEIYIVFGSKVFSFSDSKILMLVAMGEEEDKNKFFRHCLISFDIESEEISIISDFGRELFSTDYIFKQNPIEEKLGNVIIDRKEYILLEMNEIIFKNFDNQIVKRITINFPKIKINEDIKKYYDKKKPFMMKFTYSDFTPRIYNLHILSNDMYIIDTWENKKKRILNSNLDEFTLYIYDRKRDEMFTISTSYNPDNFVTIDNNRIAIHSESNLTIGNIIIKDLK